MLQAQAVIEKFLEGEVLEHALVLHLDFDLLVLLHVLEAQVVLRKIDVRDAVVVLQILRQDEQILRVQADVHQDQLRQLIRFYVMKWHVPTVDLQLLNSVLEDELGEVLQAELCHFGVLEIDQLGDLSLAKVLIRKNWMSNDLSENQRSQENVLSELDEIFTEVDQILIAMEGVLMQQLHNNLAHIIRDDELLEEVWDFVDIVVGGCVLKVVVCNVLRDGLGWRASEQELKHNRADSVNVA